MTVRSITPPLALAAGGWIVSGYLMLRLRALEDGSADAGATLLAVCDDALRSPFASALGIPLAGWGMLFYALLFLLPIFGSAAARRGALLLGVGGAGASLVLATLFVAGRVPLCPFCLGLLVINLILVVLLWRLDAPAARGRFSLIAAALAAGLLAQGWVALDVDRRVSGIREQVLADFQAAPRHEIPAEPDEPLRGPATAPLRLAVFSDFECPACRGFADYASGLHQRYGDRLAVVFKHFPLSAACNQAVSGDLHPRACDAARAAEAAHRQGAFWPFHDALFAAGDASDATLSAVAREVGLDLERFEADRRSSEIDSALTADWQLGGYLGVDRTPSVFLNGRRVRQLPALELLIEHQLESAGD